MCLPWVVGENALGYGKICLFLVMLAIIRPWVMGLLFCLKVFDQVMFTDGQQIRRWPNFYHIMRTCIWCADHRSMCKRRHATRSVSYLGDLTKYHCNLLPVAYCLLQPDNIQSAAYVTRAVWEADTVGSPLLVCGNVTAGREISILSFTTLAPKCYLVRSISWGFFFPFFSYDTTFITGRIRWYILLSN